MRQPLSWNYFIEKDNEREYKFSCPTTEVVVEHLYQRSPNDEVLTALVLARAYISKKHNNALCVEYTHIVKYNYIYQHYYYDEKNFPNMYLRSDLDIGPTLSVAIGFLLLWNKKTDRIVRPPEDFNKWYMLFGDKPWYTWSNKDQDYTEVWNKGMTNQEYEEYYNKKKENER